jgi:SAM-dependent methyltransferase
LPFADEKWDGLLAECSLSLARDLAMVLSECFRVLKAGGRLIVSDVYSRTPDTAETSIMPQSCCLSGALSREEWISTIQAHGFHLTLFEDHSIALKEFAAMLIFTHGSLEGFWQKTSCSPPREAQRINRAAKTMKPGYFLLIAEK